jgi:hypothetical protein
MFSRNYTDIAVGIVLALFGLWFALYSIAHYGRGTLARVGEGAFPAGAGLALTFFGVMILLLGLTRPGAKPMLHMKAPFFILVGTAAFALIIQPFGLIPAIVAVIIISSFADLKARLTGLVYLCIILTLISYLVFRLGLGLLIPMINWPL